MNTDIHIFLLIFQNMPYVFWMITWMKNVNNFQIAKVQPQGVAQHLLEYQPGLAYLVKVLLIKPKSIAYKKSVYVNRSSKIKTNHLDQYQKEEDEEQILAALLESTFAQNQIVYFYPVLSITQVPMEKFQ